MSRFEIDDQFLCHHKTVRALRAGAESLQMWLAVRTYVGVNNSDGVLPDEDVDDLPGAPRNPRKWLRVLVECGKPLPNGCRGAGLVDQTEGGWRLHDYRDHGLSPEEIERRRKLSRDRKRNWRQKTMGLVPRDETRDETQDSDETCSGTIDGTRRGTNASRDTPDPIRSDPDSSGERISAKDLTGSPRVDPAKTPPPNRTKPRPRDRMGDQLDGAPGRRPDVRKLHGAWKLAVGRPNDPELHGTGDSAYILAAAIDHYGLDDCLLVAVESTRDPWVNGKNDDKGAKHDSIRYIFGNEETFSRILAAAKAKTQTASGAPLKTFAERYQEQKSQGRLLDV